MAAVTDTSTEVAPPRPDSAVKEKPRGSFLHRHPRAKWLILGAAALIAVGTYFVWSYYSTRESTDDAQINGHIIPISARVSGFVEQVMVEENQEVKAGTVLGRIDPAEYRIAVEHAEADLADAQASAKGGSHHAASGHPFFSNRLSTSGIGDHRSHSAGVVHEKTFQKQFDSGGMSNRFPDEPSRKP